VRADNPNSLMTMTFSLLELGSSAQHRPHDLCLPKTHGMRFQAISLYLLIRSQSTYAVWAGFEVIKVKIEVP
jgi:hypothetical protein